MGAHFDRALLLYRQERYDDADNEIWQGLKENPGDAHAHALYALIQICRRRLELGTEEAGKAIGLAPHDPFCHYALASVLHARNRFDEALAAVGEAVRLDPHDADVWGLAASIHFARRQWPSALEAANQGLATEPDHKTCNNLRAMALIKLGRRDEAAATLDTVLAESPEDALTHANMGWALLERGDARKALEHFREALRLDPALEWARLGVIEALKARHVVYALMLRYFLWMGKLGRGAQWMVFIGGYLGYRIVLEIAEAQPKAAPVLWPVVIAYIVFAVLTWIASPLFNMLLRFNRFGRLALSRRQIIEADLMGACLLCALAGFGAWFAARSEPAVVGGLVFGFLLMPLAGAFNCHEGWPRKFMTGYAALMALAGVGLWLLVTFEPPWRAAEAAAPALLQIFLWGSILSPWVTNAALMVRPRR